MTDLPNIDPSEPDPDLDPSLAPAAPDGIPEPDPEDLDSLPGSTPGDPVPEGTNPEGADEFLTEDRAARIPLEDDEPGAEDGVVETGAGLPGEVASPGDESAIAGGPADPEDAVDPDAAPQAWEPGASGPTGTGIEGADQALADDFADPAESIDDDRVPMRDVFDTEDTTAAEQENREGDETPLDTDAPSQGFTPYDES